MFDLHQKTSLNQTQAIYLEALIEFLEVFSMEYIGTSSVNYASVFDHIQGGAFHWNTMNIETIDDAMRIIEESVLAGAPIWNLLILSPLQESIFKELELAYIRECERKAEEQRLANLKIYKCLTCAHYEISLRSGEKVKRQLPGMDVFTRRCKYIEGRSSDERDRNREERSKIERVIDYHPGSFNVLKEKNKKGCHAYQYDPERDQ